MPSGVYQRPSLLERIEAKIQPEPNSGCWLWVGSATRSDPRHLYGDIWLNGRGQRVTRILYEHKFGPIPDGLELDHLCRVTLCVNPDHLEAVTHQVNMSRGVNVGKRKPR